MHPAVNSWLPRRRLTNVQRISSYPSLHSTQGTTMAPSSSPTPAIKRKSRADVIFNPTTMGASAQGKPMPPSCPERAPRAESVSALRCSWDNPLFPCCQWQEEPTGRPQAKEWHQAGLPLPASSSSSTCQGTSGRSPWRVKLSEGLQSSGIILHIDCYL